VKVTPCILALALSASASVALAATAPLPGPPPGPGASHEAVLAFGDRAFQYSCAPCHGPGKGAGNSKYLPGTDALNVKYKGERPALLEERTDLTPDYVRFVVRHGIESMPSFRKTELGDANLDAIAAYLSRNTK
jgi:mono/diheme cytochrome c family protein